MLGARSPVLTAFGMLVAGCGGVGLEMPHVDPPELKLPELRLQNAKRELEGQRCAATTDCPADTECVAFGERSMRCVQTCNPSGGDCGGLASCGQALRVDGVEVNACIPQVPHTDASRFALEMEGFTLPLKRADGSPWRSGYFSRCALVGIERFCTPHGHQEDFKGFDRRFTGAELAAMRFELFERSASGKSLGPCEGFACQSEDRGDRVGFTLSRVDVRPPSHAFASWHQVSLQETAATASSEMTLTVTVERIR